MFREILFTQWKWTRLPLLLGTIAAFALPILSVREAGFMAGTEIQNIGDARSVLASVEAWSIVYPLLATALGLLVSLMAWNPDHRGRHVYALSLPLPRWRYALLRFGAGALLLAGPILFTTLGAWLALQFITMPYGTTAHPLALAVRFALAVWVAYSVFFAIAAGTTRSAAYVLAGIAGLVVLQLFLSAVDAPVNLLSLGGRLLLAPGPFEIFTGRWMLIDV